MERGRRWGSMLPLLAFHTVSQYYRLERKPPVTAALLAANTLIYLRPSFLHPLLPSINQVGFNPYLILKHKDLKRFFLSAFYHLNESHLVYNMLSLLWKGIQLETSMGSAEFASMVAALVVMSKVIRLLLAKLLLLFFGYERRYYKEYAVGFSGVLFAMKVILNAQSDDYTSVRGVLVPTRYAAWAELILTQMFVPGVSFLGHLGGILAGLLFLRLKVSFLGHLGGILAGLLFLLALRNIIRGLACALNWPLRFVKCLFGGQPRIGGGGTVGRRPTRDTSQLWRCPACTFDNSGRLSVCEICGTSRSGEGLASLSSTDEIEDLTAEELRRRRIQIFGR